jgi:glycosyltransferase involved in cell wall biosynthesis
LGRISLYADDGESVKIGWNLIDINTKVHSGTLNLIQRWLIALEKFDDLHQHICYATPWFYRELSRKGSVDSMKWNLVGTTNARLRVLRELFFLLNGRRVRSKIDVLVSIHAPPFVYNGPAISIVLDASPRAYPGEFNGGSRAIEKLIEWKCRKSVGWIAISEFTKKEIVRYRKYDPSRMHVVGVPMDSGTKRSVSFEQYCGKFRIERPYVFYCAVISPRKNHIRFIDAFRRAFPNREMILVLAGPAGWQCAPIMQKIEIAEAEGFVRYLGAVDNETRDAFYEGACFVAYPSCYEGFGMPVIEGFQHKKAVLTSSQSVMAEIGGDAVLLADPLDVNDMAAKCKQLFSNAQLRKDLVSRTGLVLKNFSDEKIGKTLAEALSALGRYINSP